MNIKKKANMELLVSVFWLIFYILNIILLARNVLYPKPGKFLGVVVYAVGLIVLASLQKSTLNFRKRG